MAMGKASLGRGISTSRSLIKAHPGQPWHHTKEWHAGKISDNSGIQIFFWGFFAAFWNAISWTIFIVAWRDDDAGFVPLAFISLFIAVGIGLLVPFVRSIIHWRKFGSSSFELAENPGVIGGTLGGIIHTRKNIRPRDGFTFKLACIERVVTGSGKNQSTSETVLWESGEERTQDAAADNFRYSSLPVIIDIPYDSPETSLANPRRQVIWVLMVAAEVPGLNYSAKFPVPVFKTEDST